jgi:diaminopimelate decarboxylase
MPGIRLSGIGCHIGSQLTALEPIADALGRVLGLVDELAGAGIHLQHIDVGGGLGVRYRDEQPPTPAEYAAMLHALLRGRALRLIIEPGRAIVANAGVLLTRVEYLKNNGPRRFALVDAGMNDLLRPALYGAWMDIETVRAGTAGAAVLDVAGPVCESADFLGKERALAVAAGELLAVRGAGAYAFVMSSNYNSRPRAPEIMVDGDDAFLVRRRETVDELMRGECTLPADG